MRPRSTVAALLDSFFRDYLLRQRSASPATRTAYRDALRLFVRFAAERARRRPSDLSLDDLGRDVVLAFLDHLEASRGNGVRTRNARLAAVRSFFRHVSWHDPGAVAVARGVLAIPTKRAPQPALNCLRPEELCALLSPSDDARPWDCRDRAILLFLARTGARVSEAVGANNGDVRLDAPRQVLLRGKGGKERVVPLSRDLVRALRDLRAERSDGSDPHSPLFVGRGGRRLTRFGVTHLVRRTARGAGLGARRISPHTLRHTLAMQLLRAGTDQLTIQAWLGHASADTTHRYAEADVEMMRRTLARGEVRPPRTQRFRPTDSVLMVLEGLESYVAP